MVSIFAYGRIIKIGERKSEISEDSCDDSEDTCDPLSNLKDSDEYLKEYTNDACPLQNSEKVKNFASYYHTVFSSLEPGDRLLDIGSGPMLWHLMSASATYR